MTPILLDFARKSGFTLCKEESALREMLEQFAKFIIEHEALKQPDYELIAWATTVGSHAHVSWGKDRPDYPIRYEVPFYTTPPAQEFVCSTGLCHYKEPPAPVQEPTVRTDQQIVDQTEELAVWLLSWGFNRQPETDTPMRESAHPMAQRCWSAACHIQEMLTNTDPENSVAELDVDATPPAAQRQWVGLTDEEVKKVHTDAGVTYLVPADYDRHLFTHMTDVQIMKVSRAIEAKLREKNGGKV